MVNVVPSSFHVKFSPQVPEVVESIVSGDDSSTCSVLCGWLFFLPVSAAQALPQSKPMAMPNASNSERLRFSFVRMFRSPFQFSSSISQRDFLCTLLILQDYSLFVKECRKIVLQFLIFLDTGYFHSFFCAKSPYLQSGRGILLEPQFLLVITS